KPPDEPVDLEASEVAKVKAEAAKAQELAAKQKADLLTAKAMAQKQKILQSVESLKPKYTIRKISKTLTESRPGFITGQVYVYVDGTADLVKDKKFRGSEARRYAASCIALVYPQTGLKNLSVSELYTSPAYEQPDSPYTDIQIIVYVEVKTDKWYSI